ncbi:MAG: MlaD family protein [Bacteroidia bacterium]|nr:MlaD family protein [Bacteroidia bacterium]
MTREIRIGLTVIGALLALYLGVTWVNNLHLFAPEETRYIVRVPHVAGLLTGDPVTVRGYPAGRVEAISPEAAYVTITILLDSKIKLGQDARAEIQVKELMGGKQIDILPGAQGPWLTDGAQIQGSTSLDFSSSFSKAGTLMDNLAGIRAEGLLSQADTLAQAARLLTDAADPALVRQTLVNLAETAAALRILTTEATRHPYPQQADTLLALTTAGLRQAYAIMARMDTLLDQAEQETLPEADSLINASMTLLNTTTATLARTDTLLKALHLQQGLAGRLLYDPELSHTVDSVLLHLDKTLRQLNEDKIIVGLRRGKRQ